MARVLVTDPADADTPKIIDDLTPDCLAFPLAVTIDYCIYINNML